MVLRGWEAGAGEQARWKGRRMDDQLLIPDNYQINSHQ
jgi:hypothetical protein